MSSADGGRNISATEGAVCDRCKDCDEVLFVLVPFEYANGCLEDPSNWIGANIFGIDWWALPLYVLSPTIRYKIIDMFVDTDE